MLGRIFTSNWVAIPLLIVAAISLVVLYLRGRTTEAMIGAGVLAVAAYLIVRGCRSRDDDSEGSE
jgi:hypothetical protein